MKERKRKKEKIINPSLAPRKILPFRRWKYYAKEVTPRSLFARPLTKAVELRPPLVRSSASVLERQALLGEALRHPRLPIGLLPKIPVWWLAPQ